jgi:hypothetical protein
VQDFGRAAVRCGSKPECLPKARRSAFASCGQAVAYALARFVPQPDPCTAAKNLTRSPRRRGVGRIPGIVGRAFWSSKKTVVPFFCRSCDRRYALASMSADADKAIAKADAPSAKRNAMSLRHLCAHLRPPWPTGRWLDFNIRQASVHTIRSSVNCSDHTISPNENNRATLAPIRRAAANSKLRGAISASVISAARNALQANK